VDLFFLQGRDEAQVRLIIQGTDSGKFDEV
jgi:hypothetical protein